MRSVMTAPGPLRGLRLKAVARGEEVFRRLTVIAILLAPSWVSGIHRAGTGIYSFAPCHCIPPRSII